MEGKRCTKLIQIQNPGGHKDGRASFPDQFTYKVFTNPCLKPQSLERRRKVLHLLGCVWRRERERDEGGYL
jgi:hypothetical protein